MPIRPLRMFEPGKDALLDLFSRMEFFFNRLEKYIDVRPSAAMRDIIVKIMAEVLSILGIVTKEVARGRTSTSFLVYIIIYLQKSTILQKSISKG